MVKKSVIAIIPARGGSKRIPQKNIVPFHGKPMIAYTIQAAIQSQLFEKVLVSTDSEDIAGISRNFGADVPFLRTSKNDDFSGASEATLFALGQAEEHWHTTFDVVVQLMANCPIRDADDIVSAFTHFNQNEHLSQISCFKFGFMNPWWAFKKNSQDGGEFLFPDVFGKRSQDNEELFCPTGAIWAIKGVYLKETCSFYSFATTYFELDWKSAVDIDTYDDLEFAQAVYAMKYGLL
ncbi:MAG: acylneuraminate cytidylyltransferase family protein [Euryarchaeota archaeon]|nr:acylneuraminate cytidylyltransferase family protein [Euryarchaeota archaeon]